jgi:hypothetical protein
MEKALIEGVEAPALSVRNDLPKLTRAVARASDSALAGQQALQDLASIIAQADATDPDAQALIDAIDEINGAQTDLVSVARSAADANDDIDSAITDLSPTPFVAPEQIAQVIVGIDLARAAFSDASSTAASAREHITAANAAVRSVPSLTPETMNSALADLSTADASLARVIATGAEGQDSLAAAAAVLSALPAHLVNSERVSTALTELSEAKAAAAGMQSTSLSSRDALSQAATTLASLPIGSVSLSEDAQRAYETALDGAITAMSDLASGLDEIRGIAADYEPRIAGALTVAQSLNDSTPGARTPAQVPPAVQSLLDTLFGTLDGITDIQAKSDDTLVPVGSAINGLLGLFDSTSKGVFSSLPPAAQSAIGTAFSTIRTVQGLEISVERSLFGVSNTVDGLVDTLGPLVQSGSGSDCRAEVIDNTTIHYGSSGSDVCHGTSGPDVFYVYGGSDTVYAGGSADSLHLGNGGDQAHGEGGPDHEFGGAADDSLWGGDGHDNIEDSQGNDVDKVYGGPGHDKGTVKDGDRADYWYGGDGDDPLPAYDEADNQLPPQRDSVFSAGTFP